MPTQHINPSGVSAPNAYTHVVVSAGRRIVFLSGQIGIDAQGKLAGPDLESQGVQVFENIKTCLEAAGASFADVVKLTTYIVNYKPDDRTTIGALRRRFLPSEKPPASTLVGVQALALPELLIEIEAVAILP